MRDSSSRTGHVITTVTVAPVKMPDLQNALWKEKKIRIQEMRRTKWGFRLHYVLHPGRGLKHNREYGIRSQDQSKITAAI